MASVKTTEDFDVDLFETRLESLKDTQEGIQHMSTWCLAQRPHHKKIVASWLNVFKRVRVEHRLVLFYLANDVIQYSKRKRYEFVESWATALQKATTMVRDEKVKNKILRIFSIWEQREIYNDEFLTDLCGLLNIAPPKKSHTTTIDSNDFQNASLVNSIRECVELAETTDKSFKKLPKTPNCDIESIKQQLKDKTHSDDVEKELERYVTYIGAFTKNLQAEIKCRKSVVSNIDTAVKFYANQRGEVKVVVSAYKNFGSRIKLVKKKLDEIAPSLPSPIPSPDINAPSPEPDADLQLPDDQSPFTMNFLKSNFNGYSSYMDGNLPFDINDFKREENVKTSSQPIEVIGSRSDDESYNPTADYFKPESLSAYPSSDNISIPGLAPLPVPSVPAGGYTSLARSSHQYGDILPPPPNPPLFSGAANTHTNNLHHNLSSGYSPHSGRNYNADNSYNPNVYNRRPVGASSIQPLMPPPPMPSTVGSAESTEGNDFNSTWDMNMSWNNPLESSNVSNSSYSHTPIDTPHSPPHFDSDIHNSDSTTLEYSEHDGNLSTAQDVDHRQLILPAFGIGTKLGLSKEKTRQLDIDHRNLISLTGSPGASEDKKSWYQETNEALGDMDYRIFGQQIKTIDTTTALPHLNDNSSVSSNDTTGNMISSVTSPQKNNSPSKESHKDDSYLENTEGGMAGYDPTDMVVDMDMSDDDLDDIFREVNEQNEENKDETQTTNGERDTTKQQKDKSDNKLPQQRLPLLETPAEYEHQTNWEAGAMGQGSDQEWTHMSSMSWQNSNRMSSGAAAPPPPRPPYSSQFPYGVGPCNDNGSFRLPNGGLMGERGGFNGRGGGRGWSNSPLNQFRNFPRPLRGGAGGIGSPYFNRGARGGGPGGMRGGPAFRGKFRGKNNWI